MAAEAPVSLSAGGRRICNVCCQAVAAYTCPRCHKAYCASACYKQHGQQCTEAFYREQATSQMKATRADAEQTQQMMRILKRLHEQGGLEDQQQHRPDGSSSSSSSDAGSEDGSEAGNEDEEGPAAAAAAGLDKWLAQSPEFQQLLQRAAAEGDAFEVTPSELSAELADKLGALALSGRLSHLLQPWQPWWASTAAAELSLNAAGQRVVAELQSDPQQQQQQQQRSSHEASQRQSGPAAAAAACANGSSSGSAVLQDEEGFAPLPAPPEQPLPSLTQLAGMNLKPSPLLLFELLQLLVAYCAVMHYWNGEPDCGVGSSSSSSDELCWEAAEQLLLLAPPLEQQAARLAGSSSSSSRARQLQGDAKQQETAEPLQQQQQQAVPMVADSVRCACMQLADAAAALHGELRALLPLATADGLALLRLGRAAVLLALTDSLRLLEAGRRNLKQQRLQQKQQQGRHAGSSSKTNLQNSTSKQQQQQVLLEQQLKLACRKLTFFQVWCNEQGPALYEQLSLQLAAELREQQAMNTPAAAGVQLGVRPVQPLLKQQQQQQQQLVGQVVHEAPADEQQPVKASTQQTARAQYLQQQQQLASPVRAQLTLVQAPDASTERAVVQQQQQQQQQQQMSQAIGACSNAPASDLYELD